MLGDEAPRGDGAPVGLVPAAGRASRLGALPCSKEIFPVAFAAGRARPVAAHLLDAFTDAGIGRAFILLRQGKWDVPQLLGSAWPGAADRRLELAYRVLEPTASVPETLRHALPFVAGARVALGFPDILFEPRTAYRDLLARLDAGRADVVLGLFPADRPEKTDMVDSEKGDAGDVVRVRGLRIKRPDAGLVYTWSIAVWTPAFSRYLEHFLNQDGPREREIYVGTVIEAAIADGVAVEGVTFPEGSTLDVGTPDDLRRAWRRGLRAGERSP